MEQLRDAVHYNASVWSLAGTGAPNAFVMNHPLFWLWRVAAPVVGPAAVLKVTLLLAFVAFGTGVAACATRFFGVSVPVATLAGVSATLGPGVYSTLVAGHLYEILSLGPLFWSLAIVQGSGDFRARWLGAGVVAALAALQIQILLLTLVALTIVLALRMRQRRMPRSALIFVGVAAVTVVLLAPEIWAVFAENSPAYLAPLRTLQHWELNNSSPLGAAPIAMGYFAGYAERAYASLPAGHLEQSLLWSVPLFALVGVLARWREAITWAVLLLWVVCVALVAGLNGPLAAPLAAAFERWNAASVFRELFHFASSGWGFACVLAAAGLQYLPPLLRPAGLLLPLIALISLWLPPNFASQLYNWQPPAGLSSAIRSIASSPGAWRVLFVPAEMPVGPVTGHTGGFDPSAYASGTHAPVNVYRPAGPLEVAIGLEERGDADAERWLQMLGVGAQLTEAGIVSRLQQIYEKPKSWPAFMRSGPRFPVARAAPHTSLQIRGSPIASGAIALQIVRSPLDWHSGPGFVFARDALPAAQTDPDRLPADEIISPFSTYDGIDPSRGWVRAALWAWLDPAIAASGDGLVTWSHEPLTIPPSAQKLTAVHALVINGGLSASGSLLVLAQRELSWAILPRNAHTLVATAGIVVITGFAGLPRWAPLPVPHGTTPGSQSPLRFDPATLRAEGSIPENERWIVLKQAFAPGWQLTLDRGTVLAHVPVDGFANGWRIRLNGPAYAVIEYVPARRGAWVVRLSLLLWLAAAVLTITLSYARPRRPAAR